MAEIKDEIVFSEGALNFDDDKRFMAKGDSNYRLNIIPNEVGNMYVLTNMKGNTKYSHSFDHGYDYTGSTYTVIGDCYDPTRDSVYFFIYSNGGNHSILRFNFSDNSFDKIVWDHTNIGLDIDYPIVDAFMIGDWLHFNPRSSSPRAINVQWAYWDWEATTFNAAIGGSWTVGDYVKCFHKVYVVTATGTTKGETPYDNAGYDFVSWCYDDLTIQTKVYFRYRNFYNTADTVLLAPAILLDSDTSVNYNNIRGRTFQFAYRYYVPEQGYTNASVFSDIITTIGGEVYNGELTSDITFENRIKVRIYLFDTSDNPNDNLYTKLEFLVRENPDSPWYVFEVLEHDNLIANVITVGTDVYYQATFYNDKSYVAVDNISVEKPFNPLPILSKAQWSLDGERSVYGGNTEGRDSILTDVTLEADYDTVEVPLTRNTLNLLETYTLSGSYAYTFLEVGSETNDEGVITSYQYGITIANVTGVTQGDLIILILNGKRQKGYVTNVGTTKEQYANDIVNVLLRAGRGSAEATVSGANYDVTFWMSGPVMATIERFGAAATPEFVGKHGTFKSGAWHNFCLFYYDEAMRRSDPMVSEGMSVYVPTLPELGVDEGIIQGTNYIRQINWEVNHKPPSWAKYWQWGYSGNQSIGDFWQYNVESVAVGTDDYDEFIAIDISGLQTLTIEGSGNDNFFPNSNIPAYTFQSGDRVRFVTATWFTANTTTSTTTTWEAAADYSTLYLADEGHDFEIKAFDDDENIIYIDDGALSEGNILDYNGSQTIIEIYRPLRQTDQVVYYEFGDLFSISESSGSYYHNGQTANQSDYSTNGAIGMFGHGDAYLITRAFANAPFTEVYEPAFVESYSFSDFYDSQGWGKGKPGADTNSSQKVLSSLRYSNRFIPNTEVSGLSTFDFLDFKNLSYQHGDIIAIRQAGDTLKVIFERNNASVLVNKTQLYDADGQSQIIKSDNVLGSVGYSDYHYGTIFPESVCLVDRTVYFYDIYRQVYVRMASNGIFPISDYKLRKYFKEKSEAIFSSGVSNVQVYSAYDYDYDFLYVHFVDSANSDNDELVLFYEPMNRWVTFVQINDSVQDPATTTTSTTSTSTTTSTTYEALYGGKIFGHGSMKLVSYMGEDVWIHNSNDTRNNLWGSQRRSIIDIISNDSPTVKKTFESMAIHSNKPWDVTNVSVDTDSSYVNGMTSKIPEARFTLREGIYYSDFLRNQKTNQSTASTLDLVRGEKLRGYTVESRLENDDTTEVKLFKVDITSNVSKI